ncbi:dihydroxyacetone kinase subunit DhaL [Spiroplasma endosymbiont of Anurida maritima]|uniref:dihydroxyacetone kinase subunit DhaL n=1 Tax=Spiroplasma endosymbiont of Anurida maritima TaxID=2967972 RepID=UPI0036D22B55
MFEKIIINICRVLEKNKSFLNDLDQKIGDGDHGTNINRGFYEYKNNIEQFKGLALKDKLEKLAFALMNKVGGTSGPLLGMFILTISENINTGSTDNIIESFDKALISLQALGGADLNDKTMVDSLIPAINNMKSLQDKSIQSLFKTALMGAEEGYKSIVDVVAKKGRASYLKERSIGHIDPGSYSIYLIFLAIVEVI